MLSAKFKLPSCLFGIPQVVFICEKKCLGKEILVGMGINIYQTSEQNRGGGEECLVTIPVSPKGIALMGFLNPYPPLCLIAKPRHKKS